MQAKPLINLRGDIASPGTGRNLLSGEENRETPLNTGVSGISPDTVHDGSTLNETGSAPLDPWKIRGECSPAVLPPEIRALVDDSRAWIRGKLAEHPGRADVFHRHRTADRTLDLIAGGDDSPEIFGALSERLASLHRVTREGSA
jgi:hypothetical protein